MKPGLKKVLLLALFVLVLTALFVVGASAATTTTPETDSVVSLTAENEEEPYAWAASLSDAITDANEGDTITLLKDVEGLTASLAVSKSLTIDGCATTKYKISSTVEKAIAVSGDVDFKLQNVTLEGTTYALYSTGAARVTIENSDITAASRAVCPQTASGSLTVNNCTVTATNGDSAILLFGCTGDFTFTAIGCTSIKGGSSGAIWMSGGTYKCITVQNSTLDSTHGIYIQYVTITEAVVFSAVTFKVTGQAIYEPTASNRNSTIAKMTIVGDTKVEGSNTLISHINDPVFFNGYTAENFIVINGTAYYVYDSWDAAIAAGADTSTIRTYNKALAEGVSGYEWNEKDDDGTYYTFTKEVSIDEAGASLTANGESTPYKYVATLADAITKAKEGDTITLYKDDSVSTDIELTCSVKIVGSGQTIAFTSTSSYGITVNDGISLEIDGITVTFGNHGIYKLGSGDLTVTNATVVSNNVTFELLDFSGNCTLDNVIANGDNVILPFRASNNVNSVISLNTVTITTAKNKAMEISGSTTLSITGGSEITSSKHALQLQDFSGTATIDASTLKTTASTYGVVYRPVTAETSLIINGSTIESAGVAIWSDFDTEAALASNVTLSSNVTVSGSTDILFAGNVIFASDYAGDEFVSVSGSNYNFYATLDAALADVELGAIRVYSAETPEIEGYKATWNEEGGYWTLAVVETKVYVAQIGDNYYETLAEAFAAAQNGDTVKLLEDVTVDETITIPDGKHVTLDMNGKTISVALTPTAIFKLFHIIGRMTVTGNGTISLTASVNPMMMAAQVESSSVIFDNDGELTIENGTFKNEATTDEAWVVDNSGTAEIKGGTLSSSNVAIQNANGESGEAAFLTVTDGTINGTNGAITAKAAVNAPKISISGGTIGKIETESAEGAACQTTISGGTVSSFKGESGELTLGEGANVSSITVTTPDGSQSSEDIVINDGVVYAAVAKIGDTNYATFAEALAAAGKMNTITLLANCEGEGIVTSKYITIDFNGFTYTITGTTGVQVMEGGRLTLMNGTLTVAEGVQIAKLIESYATALTVSNMTLDGTNVTGTVLEANGGTTSIVGTVINATGETFSFSVNNAAVVKVDKTIDTTAWKIKSVAKLYGGAATNINYYADLQQAVTAAPRYYTVKLLANVENGTGVVFTKDFTLDFNGFTYTVTQGTENGYGFEILATKTAVTLKNGTLTVSEAAADISALIASHGGVTLLNMTLNGSSLGAGTHVVYNDAGSCTVKGNSAILVGNGYAFKVANTLKIENVTRTEEEEKTDTVITINGVPFNKTTVSSLAEKIEAEAYVLNYVRDVFGIYGTVEQAVGAAVKYYDVVLMKDIDDGTGFALNKTITFNLNGYTYTFTECVGEGYGFRVGEGYYLTLKNGTLAVSEDAAAQFSALIYGGASVVNMTLDGTNLGKEGNTYVINNAYGTCTIKGSSSIVFNSADADAYAIKANVVKIENDVKSEEGVMIGGVKFDAKTVNGLAGKIEADAYALNYSRNVYGIYATMEQAESAASQYRGYTAVVFEEIVVE